MPRSSRRSAPPARSAPAPAARSAPTSPTTTTASRTPAAQQQYSNVPATVPQSAGPGIMGSIAANAASIAVGHTMARGIGNALGWNGGHGEAAAAAAEVPQSVQPPMEQSSYAGGYGQQTQQQPANSCANYAKDFTNCLSATNNDMQSCSYYLEQLKACQAAAAPY